MGNQTPLLLVLASLALADAPALAQAVYTPYTFTTLAGKSAWGSDDGPGSTAQFFGPSGVAVDSAGNVFVADSSNCTIRKVTPAGVVTTLAGSPGAYGTNDGTGSAARFNYPAGVAVDSAGNVFVADTRNNTIRKVTSAGAVTTLAGNAAITDQYGNHLGVMRMAPAARRGFTSLGAWRWTVRATCLWRTPATKRSEK